MKNKIKNLFTGVFDKIFGSIISYFLNKHFTFKSVDKSVSSVARFIINIAVCYLLAYGAAKPAIRYLFAGIDVSLQENIAMLSGMCVFVLLNYFGQRYFVFRKQQY